MAASTPRIDADGWVEGLRQARSPYQDDRPAGVPVELLVLHNISLPPGRFGSGCIESLFLGGLDASAHPFLEPLAGVRVSAHFLIERDGGATQFVSCHRRAWHAGVSVFEGRNSCNDFSIGIELEGTDFTAFEPAQYETLAWLARALREELPLRAVRGHSHIAPDRKTDPGARFEWRRFAALADLPAHWLP